MTKARINTVRIGISNGSDRPRIVCIEPWGEDYTLLPQETLELISWGASKPYFILNESNEVTRVWLEGDIEGYEVTQNASRIHCGHQRQAAIDAGLEF